MIAAGVHPVLAEDVVIVNQNVEMTTLSEEVLKDLFLGRKSSWADGSNVVVVLSKSSGSTETILKMVNKSPAQFQTCWKKLVFTGKGSMPERLDTDEAVAAFVAKTPGAIGFVDKEKAGTAKIVPLQ